MTTYLRTGAGILIVSLIISSLAITVRHPNGMPNLSLSPRDATKRVAPEPRASSSAFQAVVDRQLQRVRSPNGLVVTVLGAITSPTSSGSLECRALLHPSLGDVSCAEAVRWEEVP